MKVPVRVYAVPASWHPQGYWLSFTERKMHPPYDWPAEPTDRVFLGEVELCVPQPTKAQLAAAEVAVLREERSKLAEEQAEAIAKLDARIQALLAEEC